MDFCVMCGRELPIECGSQFCRTCELTAGCNFMTLKCPECGREMEIWYKDITKYEHAIWGSFARMTVDLIYHCECGCDWDSRYDTLYGDEMQTLPTRHYWG